MIYGYLTARSEPVPPAAPEAPHAPEAPNEVMVGVITGLALIVLNPAAIVTWVVIMSMLGERFPKAQFFITGTGGPGSNAHGPNEFLHVPYAERLTGCVADVIAAHYLAQQHPR